MVFLEDLLVHDDFSIAVDALGQPFISQLGLGPVHQLGVVVPDVVSASRRLEQKGIPPFFVVSGSTNLWTENGKEREFKGKKGNSIYQGKDLEILEPGEGSNFYRQSLAPAGRMAIHHLGFVVPDVDEAAEKLTDLGCPLWVRGRLEKGRYKVEFAYMDALAQCGFIIEFINYRLMGKSVKIPAGLYALLGKLQKRTGKRYWEAK